MMAAHPLFEVCLQSPEDAVAAEAGGADRVELCAALVEGGLTPDLAGLEKCLRMVSIPVMAMVRPRGGDFLYSEAEFAVMERSVALCREAGAAGIVFGCLNADGSLARARVQRLVALAGPLQTTFHRAFDVCHDPFRVMEELIDLGVDRILTSGQRATVPEGAELITELITRADGRISIMPGCGITPENVAAVLRQTGAKEFHATAFTERESGMTHRNPEVYMGIPGLPEYSRQATSVSVVKEFVRKCRTAVQSSPT